MAKKESFVFYIEFIKAFERLSNEDAGKLIKAILRYATGEPDADVILESCGIAQVIYDLITERIERDTRKYEEKCERNRQNVLQRYNRKWSEQSVLQRIFKKILLE